MAVLGLITTKTATLETPAVLAERIHEAGRFVALERLALSPQCGFSTSIIGNNITVEDQRRKLKVLVRTANEVWGELEDQDAG